ncbi:hypothetical protein VS_1090 [Vibrio atlanticus]|uniref:Uncharacterized protein n=1 Tax=Vibrio atlanticus (strain LGP32) TaxID=575788 RepID=B7VMG6_VIBA3|nr:hypothetical protein VS_1090 [Vibrio atlanticus]
MLFSLGVPIHKSLDDARYTHTTRLNQDLRNERYESIQRTTSRNILVAIKLVR